MACVNLSKQDGHGRPELLALDGHLTFYYAPACFPLKSRLFLHFSSRISDCKHFLLLLKSGYLDERVECYMRESAVISTTVERKKSIEEKPSDGNLLRRSSKDQLAKASNFGQLLENVKKLAASKGLWDDDLQRDLPKKWEKHGDMIVFPQNSFTHNNWRYIGRELWKVVADSLNIGRLGRKRTIGDDTDRTPHVDILFGENGWVEYVDERKIRFSYDCSKRVFNNVKTKEMARIAQWDCHGETVIDMYAGLGYYTFPFLMSCHAKKVISIDWDEDMAECLIRTATANNVEDKLQILQGDTRRVTPMAVADRVYLGLIPSCRAHWLTACKALKPEGGVLHIQDTIELGKKRVSKKEPLKRMPSKLASVDEEHLPKETKPAEDKVELLAKEGTSTVENGTSTEGADSTAQEPVKRKFSRSASIVEEMESRVFPDPKVLKEFEEGAWAKLDTSYKDYALDCAVSCTRFLNNIHLSDQTYGVTILNITKYGTSNPKTDHIVLDLLCCLDNAPVEKVAAQFMNTNRS